jgi:hypothetical protein
VRTFLVILTTVFASIAEAQQAPALSGRSIEELWLSLGVLAFGFLVIGFEIALMFRLAKGWGAASTRIVGITLIVVAGLFLITAGYSESQSAPMIGLLGTIAGYLLGKTELPSKE